ncbi:recombinase family protein [Chloroflexota bacterium]
MNIAAYIRVSTGEQSADNQLPGIMAYCKAKGWPEPTVYAESGSAWNQGHQPVLAKLLGELRSGKKKYACVIVWSIDRLSRAGIGEIFTLIKSFQQYSCHVVSCQESWLDGSKHSELLLAITSWIAEFESVRRSERTKAGLARVKREGKKLGRPSGAKDKGTRRKAGYLNRWLVNKGSEVVVPEPLSLSEQGK